MKIKPILFSTPMVQSILEGRKTQTRRIVKDKTATQWLNEGFTPEFVAMKENGLSKYILGDILWVRETWMYSDDLENPYWYKQNIVEEYLPEYHSSFKWKPSIFMPKEAARIFLKITNVRVERLQDISIEDVCSEGLSSNLREHDACCDLRDKWESLWCKINGADSWESNPWVWAYDFEKVERPANFLRESEAVNA